MLILRPMRTQSLAATAIGLLLIAGTLQCFAAGFKEGVTEPISLTVGERDIEDTASQVWWTSGPISQAGSEFLQFGYILDSRANVRAALVIRDLNGREIGRSPLSDVPIGKVRRTPVVNVDSVTLTLEAAERPVGLAIRIVSKSFETESRGKVTAQSAVTSWKLVREDSSRNVALRATGIAKLRFANDSVCTGFLIDSNFLVTAHHCIERGLIDGQDCSGLTIIFDYLDYNTRTVQPECVGIPRRLEGLDIAVLRIKWEAAPKRFIFKISERKAFPKSVWLLHHPGGIPLMRTNSCAADRVQSKPLIQHDCVTIGGSSGAPMLDSRGEVVGVHTHGVLDDGRSLKQLVQEHGALIVQARNIGQLAESLKAAK